MLAGTLTQSLILTSRNAGAMPRRMPIAPAGDCF